MQRELPTVPPHPAPAAQRPQDAAAGPPAGPVRWRVRLLGAVNASDGDQSIVRFPSRAAAAPPARPARPAHQARLALQPGRLHARKELVEPLWPGVALAVGRNRLHQVLSTLKSLLEPPGRPGSEVLLADRLGVRVAPGALMADAVEFERLLRAGRAAQARALYGSEMMPGFYDEWIHAERLRRAALFDAAGMPPSPPPAPAWAAAGRRRWLRRPRRWPPPDRHCPAN